MNSGWPTTFFLPIINLAGYPCRWYSTRLRTPLLCVSRSMSIVQADAAFRGASAKRCAGRLLGRVNKGMAAIDRAGLTDRTK
jgi:hypothetical protein